MPSMTPTSRLVEEWMNRYIRDNHYPGTSHSYRSIRTGRPYSQGLGWIDRNYYHNKYGAIIERIHKKGVGSYEIRLRTIGSNNHNFSQNKISNEMKKALYDKLKKEKPLGIVFTFIDIRGNFIEEV